MESLNNIFLSFAQDECQLLITSLSTWYNITVIIVMMNVNIKSVNARPYRLNWVCLELILRHWLMRYHMCAISFQFSTHLVILQNRSIYINYSTTSNKWSHKDQSLICLYSFTLNMTFIFGLPHFIWTFHDIEERVGIFFMRRFCRGNISFIISN